MVKVRRMTAADVVAGVSSEHPGTTRLRAPTTNRTPLHTHGERALATPPASPPKSGAAPGMRGDLPFFGLTSLGLSRVGADDGFARSGHSRCV